MPHIPDTHHDAHDPELIAAYAAGDAADADLEAAAAFVATCAACAELHHDLRSIAAAVPTLPAPVRPRDFRLTPEQAASLRPRGLRGLLAALASPKFSFAAPLGTGMAALGLIGVLVGSGGLPAGSGGSTSRPAAQAPAPIERSVETLVGPAASRDATGPAPAAGSPAPAASVAPDAMASAAPADVAGDMNVAGASAPSSGTAGELPYANAPASPTTEPAHPTADTAMAAKQASDQTLMVVLAAGMLLAGLALVALRWTARRVA